MTTCRVHVGRNSPTAELFDWATLDSNGYALASGRSQLGQPPLAGDCELVIASELVLLDCVSAPAALQRRVSSSLRFLVEENSIPDPEQLHVAAAAGSVKDMLSVGIIDRKWMEQMLARLERSGLVARSAYPECLLPELEPMAWTVVWNGEDSFVRTGRLDGFVLDSSDSGEPPVSLQLALNQARHAASAPERIVLRLVSDVAPPETEKWSAALGISVELGLAWRWADAQEKPALNFLQGEFAPRAMEAGWRRALKRPAILAGVLTSIWIFGIAADWATKAYERRSLQVEMRKIFRTAFGDSVVIVDAPLQMSRALGQLRNQAGQTASDDFLVLFRIVADRLLDPDKDRLESLSYVNGALNLLLRPIDAAQLDARLNEIRAKTSMTGLDIKLDTAADSRKITLQVTTSSGQAR